MTSNSHQRWEAKKLPKLLCKLLQKGQSLPLPPQLASSVDTKLNPRAPSALVFTQVLTTSCILTCWSKGKNEITLAGRKPRKCHCPLYNLCLLPITHLASCILAEPQRQKKWQLYPVISRLQVLKTMLMRGPVLFDTKNEKRWGRQNYSRLLIRGTIPEEYQPLSFLVLFYHYVILKYSKPSTDSTPFCLTALYKLSTHDDQIDYNSGLS